ncbi:hypothetical protein ACFZAR_05535 [Streptomyces sp. NPDC008222]|uniref:hypothetical protein n=1 Tax=Streptomyces sp. NPDC008222 TaxID=3364820 RepID=UPI0036E2B8DE
MFKRDSETGEEIGHRVTTPYDTTFVTGQHAHLYEDNPGYEVEEVRGYSRPDGFVVTRTVG